MRYLIPQSEVPCQKAHTQQQRRQRRRALHMPTPPVKINPEPRKKTMRRNHIQRIIQPHSRLRQQIRSRLQHRQQRQPLFEHSDRLQLPAATLTFAQMLFQPSGKFIWQLAIVQQNDTVSCVLTLHCPTSTSLKFCTFLLGSTCALIQSFPLLLHGRKPYRSSARLARSFRVARNNVFLAVSSVVLNISPIVRSFSPW